jgi:predicted transposase/invertase (TIGR01784 family)
MARYLDPKNDLPFKRIFGEHPDLLKSFLNALMPLEEGQQIESLEYLPVEQVPDNPAKKNSIVDVRCKDNRGRQFIVEMQMLWTSYFTNRMLFNASKAYVRQLDKNEEYHLLQPVYALAILNETFNNKTEFYHHYCIVDKQDADEIIAGLDFVMVELPKFKPEKWADRRMAVLWLRFLKEVTESLRVVPDELKENAEIRQALDMCEEGAFSDPELAAYDKYWDMIRVEKSFIFEYTEKGKAVGREVGRAEGLAEGKAEGLAEGKAEGLAEGKAEGLAEGEAKGREEGLAEGEAKGREEGRVETLKSIAAHALKSGMSPEAVMDLTGLTREGLASLI